MCCVLCVLVFQSPGGDGQDLFSARFEPQILAAMSRHVALFPPAQRDDSYPPQSDKSSPSSPAHNISRPLLTRFRNQTAAPQQKSSSPEKTASPRTDDLKVNGNVTRKVNATDAVFGKFQERSLEKLLQRRPTFRYVLNAVDFVPQNGVNTTLHPAKLPLSNETLASLTTFCFPGIAVQLLFANHDVHCCSSNRT